MLRSQQLSIKISCPNKTNEEINFCFHQTFFPSASIRTLPLGYRHCRFRTISLRMAQSIFRFGHFFLRFNSAQSRSTNLPNPNNRIPFRASLPCRRQSEEKKVELFRPMDGGGIAPIGLFLLPSFEARSPIFIATTDRDRRTSHGISPRDGQKQFPPPPAERVR